MGIRNPRLSGLIPDDHPWHYVIGEHEPSPKDTCGRRLAPHYVTVPNFGKIPQWATTRCSRVEGFRPALDCDGSFMCYSFQPNNNCYNYACNIATNTFAQPGRCHGIRFPPKRKTMKASYVIKAAQADGLQLIGHEDMSLEQALASPVYLEGISNAAGGHMVALLISKAETDIRWSGDYHWVRCDHLSGREWSQKDGPDHVTNFDFHGNRIVDPKSAAWTANNGPPPTHWGSKKHRISSIVVTYSFAAWMFVPFGSVSII